MVTEISHPSFEAGESRKQASVTLLIPQKHWQLFCGLKHKLSKDSGEFLEHLLENFQNGQNPELYNRNKLTTQYQSESLELQKHNFWVDPGNLAPLQDTGTFLRCFYMFFIYGFAVCAKKSRSSLKKVPFPVCPTVREAENSLQNVC